MQFQFFFIQGTFSYMETMRTLPQVSLGESKYVHKILIPLFFMLTLKFCLLFLCLHFRKFLLLLNGSQRLVIFYYFHALNKFFNFSSCTIFSLNFIGLYHSKLSLFPCNFWTCLCMLHLYIFAFNGMLKFVPTNFQE